MLTRFVACLFIFFLTNDNINDSKNEILWQSDKKLRWSDFKGQPKYWSDFAAQTVTTIEQSYTCDGNDFIFSIVAKFNKAKSWTKTGKSKRILAHEQKHFDLTEVYARKMREAYGLLKNPCEMGKPALNKIYNNLFEELRQLQFLYDEETDHGLKPEAQLQWDKYIVSALHQYNAFK